MSLSLSATNLACQHQFEQRFFDNPDGRVERSRQLPLDQQYKLFRYGMDVRHPPALDMALPIAERGAAAVPFLLDQLEADRTDKATDQILIVFFRMQLLKTYDVKADASLMNVLSTRVQRIKDEESRRISSATLQRIRGS